MKVVLVFFPSDCLYAFEWVLAVGRNPAYPGIWHVSWDVPLFKSSSMNGLTVIFPGMREAGLNPKSPNLVLYSDFPVLVFETNPGLCYDHYGLLALYV